MGKNRSVSGKSSIVILYLSRTVVSVQMSTSSYQFWLWILESILIKLSRKAPPASTSAYPVPFDDTLSAPKYQMIAFEPDLNWSPLLIDSQKFLGLATEKNVIASNLEK
ncbi:hypothetical protein YC2023_105039 [Brassica napus]